MITGLVLTLAGLAACSSPAVFSAESVPPIAERAPVAISSEILLTEEQIACAVRANLWEPVYTDAATLRLTPSGKDLGFQKDLTGRSGMHAVASGVTLENAADIHEAVHGMKAPISGNLQLRVGTIHNISDGDKAGTKVARADLSIQLAHACFLNPLAIESTGLEFVLINGEWRLAKVLP